MTGNAIGAVLLLIALLLLWAFEVGRIVGHVDNIEHERP